MKKKITIALSGATGRMGQAVQGLIQKNASSFEILETFPPEETKPKLNSHKYSCDNLLASGSQGALNISKEISHALSRWDSSQIQGVIDFSAPLLLSQILKWCVIHKKPLVSGTTNLSPAQKRALKKAGQNIPVFYEENMSWGIWQIKKWLEILSNTDYEITLTDIHHKHKKDKPSGTALKLKKHFPAFAQKKLKIKSVRTGDVFGTHSIVFKGQEEWVTLEHKALSRRLFAGGSLKALKWLIQKPPGFYSFEDLDTHYE